MEPAASAALAVAGATLLFVGFVDAAITTTGVSEQPGPLTRLLGLTLWRSARRLTSRSASPMLRAAGSVMSLTVVAVWLLCIWVGWALVFAAVPGSVVDADSDTAASFFSKLYFAASSMVTTGMGDFIPASDGWRVLTAIVSLSGLVLITLAITYLVPVINAAVDRAHFAELLSDMGPGPYDIVVRHWDGEGFDDLVATVPQVTDSITRLRAQHLAFPVLHFFHSPDPRRALAPRLAAFVEAVTLVEHGVAEDTRPPPRRLAPVYAAADGLLATLVNQSFARPRSEVPPPPSLEPLHEAGIPTVDEDSFEAALESSAQRRRDLNAYVRDDSWMWSDVYLRS